MPATPLICPGVDAGIIEGYFYFEDILLSTLQFALVKVKLVNIDASEKIFYLKLTAIKLYLEFSKLILSVLFGNLF